MSYEVKVFKITTGEEVLCKAEAVGMDYKISDARSLAFDQTGKPIMTAFMALASGRDVILKGHAIIAEVPNIDPEMEKKFLADTSGIALL